jgi:hypothetical protein
MRLQRLRRTCVSTARSPACSVRMSRDGLPLTAAGRTALCVPPRSTSVEPAGAVLNARRSVHHGLDCFVTCPALCVSRHVPPLEAGST